MNNLKLKYLFVLMVSGLLAFASCADLSVDNVNDPTTEAVEGDESNQVKLLAGGFFDATTSMVTTWGTHIHNLADQSTGTNAFRRYWDFSEEPRLRIDNTTAYSASAAITAYFGGFNSAIATSNLFIANEELSDDIRAQAYFLRGISRGYLGMIYDQSYFLDEDFDATTDNADFQPYTALIDGALSDIDEAISLASGSSTFVLNAMPNPADSWTQAEFLDIANSLAARIAAGRARTASEAATLDWDRILTYANAGLGGPNSLSGINTFSATNIGSSGEYANYFTDWLNFVVTGGFDTGHGYNPTDVKIPHMLDTSYPVIYPAENVSASEANYPPADSDDPRIDYFKYTTNPGFLDPTRNANLFTNYFSARMFAESDWWPAENKIIFMTSSEVDYLRAEAQLMGGGSGGTVAAAQTLNESPAGTGLTDLDGFQLPSVRLGYTEQNSLSGGHTMDGTESVAEFQFALLREYSVELDQLGGIGIQWFFMRRHDMLQEGTATMFPVPGSELEILGLENYTFGGPSFAGQEGSASGANSWKNLAEAAFGTPAVTTSGTANSEVSRSQEYLLPVEARDIPSPVQLGKKALNN